MIIWIDAHLSPALAPWLTAQYEEIEAFSVKYLGLRDADDEVIFQAAREANAVVMTKDQDFVNLVERFGPPPRVIWITCGNTTNAYLRNLLSSHMPEIVTLLSTEALVEISD